MAITPRPPKANNNTTFQGEVASGKRDIIDSELDGDLDTIYALCNGNLDNANISATAQIHYSKLNLTGGIKTSDLSPSFQLPGGTVAPGSITVEKLAAGATTPAVATGVLAAPLIGISDVNPRALAEVVWTSRSVASWHLALATLGGKMFVATVAEATVALQAFLHLDATMAAPTTGTVVGSSQITSASIGAVQAAAPASITIAIPFTAVAGNHRLVFWCQNSVPAAPLITDIVVAQLTVFHFA